MTRRPGQSQCVAWEMSEARIEVEQLERLAFLVMAPEEQIRIEKTFEFVRPEPH